MDVNELTGSSFTPLMWTCVFGKEAMTRRLLEHGANVQATDSEGQTVLHFACIHEWVDGVALLLAYGADPDARDGDGDLPEDGWSVDSPHRATLLDLLDAARHAAQHGCGLK
jgi:ankyrin repeat protein